MQLNKIKVIDPLSRDKLPGVGLPLGIGQAKRRRRFKASSGPGIVNNKKTTRRESVGSLYHRCVKYCIRHLRKRRFEAFSLIAGTILAEPFYVLKSALTTPLGWCENFHFNDLNPKKLTDQQLSQNPVLLIHGNYDNQRAWLRLAGKLRSEGIAAFTVNLPSGELTGLDKTILENKWREIKELYQSFGCKDFGINVVGHSRGGLLSVMMGMDPAGWNISDKGKLLVDIIKIKKRQGLGKIIQIGQYFSRTDFLYRLVQEAGLLNSIYCITGERDIFALGESDALRYDHKFRFDEGHLSLLFSEIVDKTILNLLKNRFCIS